MIVVAVVFVVWVEPVVVVWVPAELVPSVRMFVVLVSVVEVSVFVVPADIVVFVLPVLSEM